MFHMKHEPDWYKTSDQLPPLSVKVRVVWDGRMFEAAMARNPDAKRVMWVTVDRHGPHWLPSQGPPPDASRPWAGWHTLEGHQPDYWQPLNAAMWSLPLPPAHQFRETESIMWAAKSRFQAVEDAEGADLAREMEADRAMARDGRPRAATGKGQVPAQWWRDATQVAYQPKGEITMKMAEARILRAVAFCGVGRGLTLESRTPLDVLAAVADAYEQAMNSDPPDPMARFRPLPCDQSDFDTAMGWFVALAPVEARGKGWKPWGLTRLQKILVWRARDVPLSFDDIGGIWNVSGSNVKQMYHGGKGRAGVIEKVWRAANGLPIHRSIKVADQMAELRERNRAFKRKAG